MLKFFKFILPTLLVLVLLVGGEASAKTVAKAKPVPKLAPFHYERIFYYSEGKAGRSSFALHAKQVDVLAPQSYTIDAGGNLKGGVKADILAIAQQNKVKVMPLFTNKGFSMSSAEAFLDSPTAQSAAITALVDEAVKNNYWGWQADFEQVEISYRDKFTAFISDLHDALKNQGKILSVAVISQISQDPADYKNDYWQKFIGVYDFGALASSSDFISLMSYDDPGSTGPAARFPWVQKVVAYALNFIPPEKLSVGIPLYFWQWNENTGRRVGVGGYKGIKTVLARKYVKKGYDNSVDSAYIRFVRRGVPYTVWYENDQSVQKKIALIQKFGLHGFSAWAIGLEVPRVYNALD